jgi:outer membrane protein assembly factor BamA
MMFGKRCNCGCLFIVLLFFRVFQGKSWGGSLPQDSTKDTTLTQTAIEALPIIMYDTDVGFGYGAKAFLLNHLSLNESFDLIFFQSTKGERWYRLVFSIPDFERRQGTVYPLALDLVIDYDKYIKNDFFGVGNAAAFDAREYYTREPLEISLTLSRGFSPHLVGQIGGRFKAVRNFNFSSDSRLVKLSPELNRSRASYGSLFLTFRYDTRNSYINPTRGVVLQGEAEVAPHSGLANVTFARLAAWCQHYSELLSAKTVLAWRLGVQSLFGNNLPVQVLLPIGGGSTLRGSPQDRYLDKVSGLFNGEIRFPILWRFGGVAGIDAGKVWASLSEIDLRRWAVNPTVGLRFYLDTFIIRADVGLGKETTGFYFNFGQMF